MSHSWCLVCTCIRSFYYFREGLLLPAPCVGIRGPVMVSAKIVAQLSKEDIMGFVHKPFYQRR